MTTKPMIKQTVGCKNRRNMGDNIERALIEMEKIAATGRIMRGIIHEINNHLCSIISNNSQYNNFFQSILPLVTLYDKLLITMAGGEKHSQEEFISAVCKVMEKADISSFLNDVDGMREDVTMGLMKIKDIMKHFRYFILVNDEEQEANINESLEAVLSVLAYDIRKHGGITTSFGDIMPVIGNPAELNLAFLNIILNCLNRIKGQGSFSLTTRQDGDVSVVEIEYVGDTFSPDEVNTTAVSSITKSTDFTEPFGLFFARTIVEKYSGSMTLDSTSGHGSAILIRLPSISGET